MPSLFRKRSAAVTETAAPDLEDILASIPDVPVSDPAKGAKPAPSPPAPAAGPPAEAGAIPLPPSTWQPPGAAAIVAQFRRDVEAVFAREVNKVGDALAASHRDLEARLTRALADADALRRENAELRRQNEEYARTAAALKELARTFERA